MNRLSLLSACIFALFLASCGGSGSGSAGSSNPADADSDGVPDLLDQCSPSAEKFVSTPKPTTIKTVAKMTAKTPMTTMIR